MQKQDHHFSELLQRYLNGECEPEEEKLVRDWYNSLGTGREPLPLDGEEASDLQYRLWQNIRNRSAGLPNGREAGKPWVKWLLYSSASAAVLLLLFTFLFQRGGKEPTARDSQQAANPAVYHKTNNSSETILVVLQDESMVWLKPSGSIQYKNFSESPLREVTLKGEAYFEVAKDPEKPFLVHSGNVITRVTGTKFNIKAYETDKTVEIEVTEGSVEVSGANVDLSGTDAEAGKTNTEASGTTGKEITHRPANIKLTARQKAVYHTGSRKLEKISSISSALQPVRKISQQLAFEFSDTPLRKVIDLLEEAYLVSIELENKDLESCPLTASLNDETLEIKMELICRSIGATFYRSPGKIMISGEGCAH